MKSVCWGENLANFMLVSLIECSASNRNDTLGNVEAPSLQISSTGFNEKGQPLT
jgi:hypothetical protein